MEATRPMMSAADQAELNRFVHDHNLRINPERQPQQSLGKDDFLKILITQLSFQDPTSPMEDKEFIAQMAQFSTLEQISNLNKEMRTLVQSSRSAEAYSMLGREIQAYDPIQQKTISGTVNSVFYKGEEIMIGVGDEHISMASIHSVNLREKMN